MIYWIYWVFAVTSFIIFFSLLYQEEARSSNGWVTGDDVMLFLLFTILPTIFWPLAWSLIILYFLIIKPLIYLNKKIYEKNH
jgi:hypothetical protein